MKNNITKFVLTTLFLTLGLYPNSFASTTETNISTYNPSLTGQYNYLHIIPRGNMPACTSTEEGLVYSKSDEGGRLYICNNGVWDLLMGYGGIWTKSGHNIFPYETATNPSQLLGIGTSEPEFKLDVIGDIYAEGEFGFGYDLGDVDSTTAFIWHPKTGSIRAGGAVAPNWNESNIGLMSNAFGYNNKAEGDYSVISGGHSNIAEGQYSTIAGGKGNRALTSDYISMGAGENNTSYGAYSFIGAGFENQIGIDATTRGDYSAIGGGYQNKIESEHSVIIGGYKNEIKTGANFSGIGGGETNIINANSNHSYIGGGKGHRITGHHSAIIGGVSNNIFANYGAIGGGYLNYAGANHSIIAGGLINRATGAYSTVTGGVFNEAAGQYATVLGGLENKATGLGAFIAGGQRNTASGEYATVVGGFTNTASGKYSIVHGGQGNTAAGEGSVVQGGLNVAVNGKDSWGFGQNLTVNGNNTFAFAKNVTVDQDNSFIVQGKFIGIGTTNLRLWHTLNLNGNLRITNGSFYISPGNTLATGHQLKWDGTKIHRDIAEIFNASQNVEIGDVLVIDETDELLVKQSSSAYDKKVVGIVSAAPAIVFEGNQMILAPEAFKFKKGTRPPVALAGQVPCKVTLENGPIKKGDALTSSSLAGHAMKADHDIYKARGTIVAKALEDFDGTAGNLTGMINVLVSLQ